MQSRTTSTAQLCKSAHCRSASIFDDLKKKKSKEWGAAEKHRVSCFPMTGSKTWNVWLVTRWERRFKAGGLRHPSHSSSCLCLPRLSSHLMVRGCAAVTSCSRRGRGARRVWIITLEASRRSAHEKERRLSTISPLCCRLNRPIPQLFLFINTLICILWDVLCSHLCYNYICVHIYTYINICIYIVYMFHFWEVLICISTG